jgi:SET domain-containing protein
MANVFVEKSKIHGRAVFASQNFKKGDFVLAIDDSHVVLNESKLTAKQHAFDLDYLENKTILMQAPEKYINHSCDPNVYVKTVKGIRNVYAMRNILKGDEIVYDYSINGFNEGTFKCHCGSKNCQKVYQGNFFKLPVALQQKYLPFLDTWFKRKFKKDIDQLKQRRK